MKKTMREMISKVFGSPFLPVAVIAVSLCSTVLTSDSFAREPDPEPESIPVEEIIAEESTTTTTVTTTTTTKKTTTTTSTTTTSTTAETTTSAETEAPPAAPTENRPASTPTEPAPSGGDSGNNNNTPPPPNYGYTYISAGESPNSSFYQSRLVIVGDSIASGFCAYGYIPPGHNVAKESMAVWNMNRYTFDFGGGQMGVVDAAGYLNSSLYLVSIGMNDIFSYSPDDLANRLKGIAEQIIERVPDATVVIGAITPVSNPNYYTNNDTLRNFNTAFENVVNDLGSPQILFFNTHAVLSDPNTGALAGGYGGGDGLHLNSSAYRYALNCLFNCLDEKNVREQMEKHDSQFEN